MGAIGLMQVMPGGALADHNTFGKCGTNYTADDMFNIKKNLHVGKWYLKKLGRYYNGDKVKQVSAYNMGPGNTDKGIINFSYTFKILGTNIVLSWLGDKKVTPWKGSSRVYYVLE